MGSGIHLIVNFLSALANSGMAYRAINIFRSAISAEHPQVDGKLVGEHPLVCKVVRGIRLVNSPKPKYSTLWDVNVVTFLRTWPANEGLSSKQLSAKRTVLLCLVSCRRVSDVRALDLAGRVFTPAGVSFTISRRTKTHSRCISYPAFPHHGKLCVVQCLKCYEDCTREIRNDVAGQLLISLQRPFRPVTASTLARWVTWLRLAGIDTMFGAHSVRGAVASKAFYTGSRLQDIMTAAGWSSDSTFKTFYHKPIVDVASTVVEQL